MKEINLFIIGFILSSINGFSQTKTIGFSDLPISINFSDSNFIDFEASLISIDKQPIPASEYLDKKQIIHQMRTTHEQRNLQIDKSSRGSAVSPQITKGLEGNAANGAPSDNDIAISDSGIVVSAVNTNIRIYDPNGNVVLNRNLTQLTNLLSSFSSTSDPRLLYDQAADRFIIVFFSGSLSTTSNIFVGFSKTNNPTAGWNFYKLNGNSFNDSTWSDYPIIAVSDSDLFMTFNQVKDNVSWTVGFKQSVIWQIDKQKGYDGDSLIYTLWSDIKSDGKYLRNIYPAKPQLPNNGNKMYFLSVKNVSFSSDSLFVLDINNSHSSGNAQLNQKLLKTPINYGFPPDARQKKSGNGINQYLMTNDARVLSAIYENDYVHFGLNSTNFDFFNAGVMLGTIKNVSSNNPRVEAKIFSSQNTEYGYPSMTYMGNVPSDHKVMYSFSHCYTDSVPGTSVIYKDANDNFSDVIEVKNGLNSIDMFSDSIERWGDYTGIQRIYSPSNKAILAGSWGSANNRMRTWIAEIEVYDPTTDIKENQVSKYIDAYPNPSLSFFNLKFEMPNQQNLIFTLYDNNGSLVSHLLTKTAYAGENEFSFKINELATGIYVLKIEGDKNFNQSKIIIKSND
jgi:hypothetical protein